MNHPCFDAGARRHWGRLHLPIAPECNIVCAYCDRRHDCANESRPGVASAVMTPEEAVRHVEKVLAAVPNISVAGIAGPGDPFATPDLTLRALRLLRRLAVQPCLSTNGLELAEYVPELKRLGVRYVTLTINAVDPEVGRNIYLSVRRRGVVHGGAEGAALLLRRQIEALAALKRHGMTVKINAVVIPGMNDRHIGEVARLAAAYRADVMNCLAVIPVPGTAVAGVPAPDRELMERVAAEAGRHMALMRHCSRCRADAVGLLPAVPAGTAAHACRMTHAPVA